MSDKEKQLKKVAERLTNRFYNNIVASEDYNYFKAFYDGLYEDVLQELINARADERKSAIDECIEVCQQFANRIPFHSQAQDIIEQLKETTKE